MVASWLTLPITSLAARPRWSQRRPTAVVVVESWMVAPLTLVQPLAVNWTRVLRRKTALPAPARVLEDSSR
ncbi:hypothetical protein D3C86_1895410 [compost metagenome]